MLREWEEGGQKAGPQRVKDLRAPEQMDQVAQCCRRDRDSTASMQTWTKFYTTDPSIAPGKYSPLEKEILRLGGLHTVASRRFLTHKQQEERKMLRELQLRSSDYKRVLEYRKRFPEPCTPFGLLEKIWTAKVTVSPAELPVPPRERLDIGRHVERMQLARALRLHRPLPAIQRARHPGTPPGGGPSTAEGEGAADVEAAPGESEDRTTQRQEIKINVTFKSKEPPKPLTHQPRDLRPFFPPKRGERSIAGSTNRSLFRPADFPGDLMLMNQDFFSRGLRPSDLANASLHPAHQGVWSEPPDKPASHQH